MGFFKRDVKPKNENKILKKESMELKNTVKCKVCGNKINRDEGVQFPGMSEDWIYCQKCWDKRNKTLLNGAFNFGEEKFEAIKKQYVPEDKIETKTDKDGNKYQIYQTPDVLYFNFDPKEKNYVKKPKKPSKNQLEKMAELKKESFLDEEHIIKKPKKTLCLIGEKNDLEYCKSSYVFYQLRYRGIDKINIINNRIKEKFAHFEFDISEFSEKLINELIDQIKKFNSGEHNVIDFSIKKYYNCRFCHYDFDCTKSFVCPRCKKTN